MDDLALTQKIMLAGLEFLFGLIFLEPANDFFNRLWGHGRRAFGGFLAHQTPPHQWRMKD
jgi:hypothetical protein